jgi:hypothetical protein
MGLISQISLYFNMTAELTGGRIADESGDFIMAYPGGNYSRQVQFADEGNGLVEVMLLEYAESGGNPQYSERASGSAGWARTLDEARAIYARVSEDWDRIIRQIERREEEQRRFITIAANTVKKAAC